jgi:iron complex outermembrane receptor protein
MPRDRVVALRGLSPLVRSTTHPLGHPARATCIAPGTITYNTNGVGLGQGMIYYRGFQDGDFNITWDGIPFNDSNNPTHHSWVFFPGVWIGNVDFDRYDGPCDGPHGSSGWITEANCSIAANDALGNPPPCATDKLNSYRKYGETSTISQTSKHGVLRFGMWYEWATSNRYQIPSDPLTFQDDAIPYFHENYWTNSYNPYVEYGWHPTKKLTLIAGDKYAYYTLDFKQYADDGKVVANLNGAPFTVSSGGFGANLPSASANYRLTKYWSAYAQFGKGDEIPPTSVFDVTGGGQEVSTLPKPQMTSAYEGGTVVKMNRFTLDGDYYVVRFQNNYVAYQAGVNSQGYNLNEYYLGPDSTTQGFESEASVALGYGFNVYANGTVGKATYRGSGVPSGLNVTDTPSFTQDLAVTYQHHAWDLGVIEKRIGHYYDDNGSYHNQVSIAPYNNVNLFANYTIRKPSSFFDQSKISFSVNNVFNSENITDVYPANSPVPVGTSAYFATTAPSPIDQINMTAGRSFMVSFKLGVFPNRHKS